MRAPVEAKSRKTAARGLQKEVHFEVQPPARMQPAWAAAPLILFAPASLALCSLAGLDRRVQPRAPVTERRNRALVAVAVILVFGVAQDRRAGSSGLGSIVSGS